MPLPPAAAALRRLPERAALVVVDVQERLLPVMAAAQQPVVVKAVGVLGALAAEAGWPIVITEQYPKGLGPTVPALHEALIAAGAAAPLAKTSFSACRADGFAGRLDGVEACIVTGMETHVCVLQTVMDLLDRGRTVLVPWDAVASRREEDRQTALDLMRRAGAIVTSSETLVFQHLEEAGGESFKRLSKLLK